jgi:hypothetical protein
VAKTSFAICQMRIPHSPHTPPKINRSAINHQVRRAGTKMAAHGCPQQHSKLAILSAAVHKREKRFG